MQYKSQDAAMQAKSLDGQGKPHSHAPNAGAYGPVARSSSHAGAPAASLLADATYKVQHMGAAVLDRARRNVGAANAYVHDQPWKFIGAGAAAGFVLGLLLARRR